MNFPVLIRTYDAPELCESEILRYAGCKSADESTLSLLHECLNELNGKLCYKVCFMKLPCTVDGDTADLSAFKVRSKALARNLSKCKNVILFAATVGVHLDRLIARYGHIAPSKALMMQAIGAERIEALCDIFCEDIKNEEHCVLRPRFSPGYGDLALDVQKDIFALLECHKRIGVALNKSLLMSPSKSVTAFIGIRSTEE